MAHSWILALASVVATYYCYLVTTQYRDMNLILAVIVKPLPVLLSAYYLHQNTKALPKTSPTRKTAVLLLWGLIFGSLGDVALIFDWHIKSFFALGLGLFLVGHILNIKGMSLFSEAQGGVRLGLPYVILIYPLSLYVYYLFYNANLPAKLRVPVFVYIFTLATAAWRAIARVGAPGEDRTAQICLCIGYLSFTLSDTILGYNKFVGAITANDPLVYMITYYSAQLLIAASQPLDRATFVVAASKRSD